MRSWAALVGLAALAAVGGVGTGSAAHAEAATAEPVRHTQAARPACRVVVALQGRPVLRSGRPGVQRLVIVNRGRRPATGISLRVSVSGSARFARPSAGLRLAGARRVQAGPVPRLGRGTARRIGLRLGASRPRSTTTGRVVARVRYRCGGRSRTAGARRRATVLGPGLAPPPRPAPTTGSRFATLPVGSRLPSGAECARRVRPAPEIRPENAAANARRGVGIRPYGGQKLGLNHPLQGRVDGDFTGTTDELIQWASCKWGFDEDITRARVVAESYWTQSARGDRHDDAARCRSFGMAAPCFESYGLLQVRPPFHPGTWPAAGDSTAFNLDYAMAFLRVCFVGGFEWLGPQYRPGDEWGCVGTWFAGRWKTPGAVEYNRTVRRHLAEKPWSAPGF